MAIGEYIEGPAPTLKHVLAVAYRFIDVFTQSAVVEPLRVSIPALEWTAYRSPRDSTYRFLVSNDEPIPAGTFDILVEAPGGEYRNAEPLQVTLPLPPIAHPLPVVRSDYLREAPLWPTRRRTMPPAETAVIGRVTSNLGTTTVPGLRVFLFEPPPPPPALPYASVDEEGNFVFRLPGLVGSMSGSTVVDEVTLNVEASDGMVGVTINPSTLLVPLGRVSVVELTVP